MFLPNQYRTFFAGASTAALMMIAVSALLGAKEVRHETFNEITVGRINIVEPDGTKRLIISNRAQFPGEFTQGKETPRPDRRSSAGMIFVDDEGTENGGFLQRGSIKNGKVDASLSLTFDRFRQDQTIQLLQSEDGVGSTASLVINDRPSHQQIHISQLAKEIKAIDKLPKTEQEAAWKKMRQDGKLGAGRVFLGTTLDSGSSLMLKDGQGNPRMMLLVTKEGKAEIRMLDNEGKIQKRITASE